jgi:hypothetical protein
MKVNDRMRFPHPVLWKAAADFKSGSFGFKRFRVEERDGRVVIDADIELANQDLERLLEDGALAIGVDVACRDTYFASNVPGSPGPFTHEFSGEELSGDVVFRPMAWATRALELSGMVTIETSFWDAQVVVCTGAVLALGSPERCSIGRDKLAPLASVFELQRSDELAPGRFDVTFDEDLVGIRAGADAHQVIASLRGTREGRVGALNAVYLPVVCRVMDEMRGNTDHSSKKWFRVISAKLTTLGIDVENADSLETAQILLREPILKMRPSE